MNRIKSALISVSDKTGLVALAKTLVELKIDIFSTGGTRAHLEEAGVSVHDVGHYTGFPEMMDGRLKTLHPKIFGGILARRDREDDMASLREHEIRCFDLVVVNLYPFQATVASPETTVAQAIEKIDIGGPSLVRAAAKNQAFVTIVTEPSQYESVASEIKSCGETTVATRTSLATAAFRHTADYDAAITAYFSQRATENNREGEAPSEPRLAAVCKTNPAPVTPCATEHCPSSFIDSTDAPSDRFPESVGVDFRRVSALRYGENPHQQAAIYTDANDSNSREAAGDASIVAAKQLNGKDLSYNNYLDLDSALCVSKSFDAPTVSVIKHNNPCGVASSDRIEEALQKALDGDPTSAFGSILGFNRTLSAACAEALATPGLFVEAIIAPEFERAAIDILTTKPKWKKNVRLMEIGPLEESPASVSIRPIAGGALLQESDDRPSTYEAWRVVTERQPDAMQLAELRFAWEVVRHVRSNAIVVARNTAAVGVGAGQMSRVDAVEIAIRKAGDRAEAAVLSSDAFFPFPDSIETAAAAGITAIAQPGGSKQDDEVIAACDRLGLAMVFTGRRHFKH